MSLRVLSALCILCGVLHTTTAQETADSILRAEMKYRFDSSAVEPDFNSNRQNFEIIDNFFASGAAARLNSIKITGEASPEGDAGYNLRLAGRRARATGGYLLKKFGIRKDIISLDSIVASDSFGDSRSYPDLRKSEIVFGFSPLSVSNTLCPAEASGLSDTAQDTESTACSSTVTDACSSCSGHESVEYGSRQGKGFPRIFLSTNMLYDALLVPNIGLGVYLGGNISVFADWMHAWWSNAGRHRYWRIYGGDLEVNYRFGRKNRHSSPFAGHHLGIYASAMTYDFQFGAKHEGILADHFNYAAGISYGYTLPVARRLDIGFSIGVGYMWGKYKKHRPIDEHDVWQSTHRRNWFGPTRAEVSLRWLIGPGNVNIGKGGER